MSAPEGRKNQRDAVGPAADAEVTLPPPNEPIGRPSAVTHDRADEATLPPPGPGWQGASTVHWIHDAADATASVDLPEVPGYQVLRFVARGGMGVVLEARHVVLDRLVAIKLPLPHTITCDADRQRFLREARSAASLRHPHICAIHEVGEAEGRPFIAMDFIRGETLEHWRASRQPSARQVAEVMAVLARAVGFAHERGVVHRDLKPSNVIVERETGSPILTDF